MAQMIPDRLPDRASKGEGRVFDILKRLPDDCIVYYEPTIRNRYPDFIVIMPSVGVMVIEVKGWYVKEILHIDNQNIKIKRDDQPEPETQMHPARQVREYMFSLMDTCKNSRFGSPLLRKSGEYEGKFCFPFNSMVVLSNAERHDLLHSPLGDITQFFGKNTITRDELMELYDKDWNESQWAGWLKSLVSMTWNTCMTPEQIDALRAIIHPEAVLTPPNYVSSSSDCPTLKVLDLAQEREARRIGAGHRLLWGVAGSGKTVMLIGRAKMLAQENPNAQILVTCFNIVLAAYLESVFADYPNITAMHFHRIARTRWEVKQEKDETPEMFGEKILKKIETESNPALAKYDMILVDEAQDFDPSWFKCILELLADRYDGDLVIVGDGLQGIYKTRKVSWKSIGIRAQGRTKYFEVNYRNSKEIIQLASSFSSFSKPSEADNDSGVEDVVLNAEKSTRAAGLKPLLLEGQKSSEIISEFVNIVSDLLKGTFRGKALDAPLHPGEIAVLYPARTSALYSAVPDLVSALGTITEVNWLNEQGWKSKVKISSPDLKISTIHSAKGLQYKAVLLFGTEVLPIRSNSEDAMTEAEKLLYVAMTRAESILVIGYTASTIFVERLKKLAQSGFCDTSVIEQTQTPSNS
ncbi:MAG: AAA family ATPase [Synergistaceae bacterium]|nr:AAA family ATPase [Synergistaceae bacterium]